MNAARARHGNGRLVVVVEDNERNARLVEDVLTAHGFVTEVIDNGTDAIACIPSLSPALVILDIDLPDIDGVEVLHGLRLSACGAVPVVAVTAYAMNGDRERFLEEGFDEYFAKPLDIATFPDAIVAVLDG